ncbi:hypothetical protein EDB84DRAFT_1444568 [Lactarius hengduanensis]|nr:hypothetical protein EDB84DRAFT_1444568 [Lactarius hengduanensis]
MSTGDAPSGMSSGDAPSGDDPTPKAIKVIEGKRARDMNKALIHEATLQDLLRCRNDAMYRILGERNRLLRERIELGAREFDFSEVDYLYGPPPSPPPYATTPDGIRRYHANKHSWLHFPEDRRVFNKCVQTDDQGTDPDPDSTLADVDPDILAESSDSRNKKRKIE